MPAESPVYVCTPEPEHARHQVDALRAIGLRARSFASEAVLANAARAQPPAAVVIEWGERSAETLQALPAETCRLCLVPTDGLAAAMAASAAGADAVLDPATPPSLLQHLVWRLVTAPAPVIAVVDEDAEPTHLAVSLHEAGGEVRSLAVGEALLAELRATGPELVLLRTGQARRLARLIEQTPGLAGAEVRPVNGTPAEMLVQRARALQRRRLLATASALRDPGTGTTPAADVAALAAGLRERAAARGERAAVVALRTGTERTEAGFELLAGGLPALAVPFVMADGVVAALTSAGDDAGLARQLGDLRAAAAAELPDAELAHAPLEGPLPGVEALFSTATGTAPEPAAADGEALDRRIRQALEDEALRLVYQPISSLSGHPGRFFEVFVRLADGGDDALPADFVRVARAGGHAPALDRGVLERALEVLATHETDGPTLFVKLFPESLAEPELAAWLAARLAERGVAPERLVLQLSHPTLCARRAETEARMRELRGLGCRLAVEHFDDALEAGETLAGPAIDFLKLSHRLTDGLAEQPERVERVRGIAREAARHEVGTIACLVQDAANLSVLWQAGVTYIQGYFMQAPEAIFASAPEAEA